MLLMVPLLAAAICADTLSVVVVGVAIYATSSLAMFHVHSANAKLLWSRDGHSDCGKSGGCNARKVDMAVS